MDFNNINSRLERLQASVESKLDPDIRKHTEINAVVDEVSTSVSGNFNKDKLVNKENQILIIVHNLANLKDHLKNKFETAGGNKQLIEDEITKSKHLQIVIDLANAEKHSYPTTSNRSGLNPAIANVSSYMALSTSQPGDVSQFNWNFDGSFSATGNTAINIQADILDDNGNKLMTLDELISECIIAWDDIISKFNLI